MYKFNNYSLICSSNDEEQTELINEYNKIDAMHTFSMITNLMFQLKL
jgi:hypothetical protein